MKKIVSLFALMLLVCFTACKKEEIKPNHSCGDNIPEQRSVSKYGPDWDMAVEPNQLSRDPNTGTSGDSEDEGGGITDPNDDEDLHRNKKGKK